jgi:lipopolysaccharide export system ATP-binding protein
MTLQINKIVKTLGSKILLDDVSYQVEPGQIVGLLGPNGAGKSTSFYVALGLTYHQSGIVLLDKTDITTLPTFKRARLGIAYLPQDSSIFTKLTVEENLLIAIESTHNQDTNCLESLILQFDLNAIRKSFGYMLSGGEKRRVEIARALATKPKYLLLDEPFAGIDPIAITEIKKIILNLKKSGIGILITDHNIKDVLPIVDLCYIIYDGKVFTKGTPAELLMNAEVKKIYLGEDFKL